jgi:lysozyme
VNPRNKWLAGSASAFALLFAGLTLWEGNEPKPYFDVARIKTVCRGHTGPDIEDRIYSPAECDALTREDVAEHSAAVLRCVNVPINERVYTALVMFTFNVGGDAFCKSSLLRKLNAGDFVGACEGLMAWNKATINGKLTEVRGLTRRRDYERRLCLSGLA